MALTRIKGSTWDTSDNLVVDLVSDLYNISREGIIFVTGMAYVNDGGGGWFRYDITVDRNTHDGINVIDPTGTGAGNGCWVRQSFRNNPESKSYEEVQIAIANQQDFELTQFTYPPGQGLLSVYANGLRLTALGFTETSPSTVRLHSPQQAGTPIAFIGYEGPQSGDIISLAASQVSFNNVGTALAADDVQDALEELDAALSGWNGEPGTGPNDARQISYTPIEPDTSTNVQAGMHWIQYTATQHINKALGAHTGEAISFDNRGSGLSATTVQAAILEVTGQSGGGSAITTTFDPSTTSLESENVQAVIEEVHANAETDALVLATHIGQISNSHKAPAIKFESQDNRFSQTLNVHLALEKLSYDLTVINLDALQVFYDNSQSGMLSDNVKAALDEIWLRGTNHDNSSSAHHADSIVVTPGGGLIATNAMNAFTELDQEIMAHVGDPTQAHAASAISFSNANTGFISNNVQDAVIEAARLGMIYKGHLDMTIPFVPPLEAWTANDYFTAPQDGTVDPSWNAYIGIVPANVVSGGSWLYDGSLFHYLGSSGGVSGNEIINNPSPGVSQTIVTGAVGDNALILDGQPGQTADLFVVHGKGSFDELVSSSTVSDVSGTLRQDASQVPFDNTNTGYDAGNTQAALEEIEGDLLDHFAGNLSRHTAGLTTFTPVAGAITSSNTQAAVEEVETKIRAHLDAASNVHAATAIGFLSPTGYLDALNVSEGLEEVQGNILGHTGAAVGHTALKISYDKTASGLSATNVQAAVDELYANRTGHEENPTGAHAASAISYSPTAPDTSPNVQVGLSNVNLRIDAHENVSSGIKHPAGLISFDPALSDYTATNVQAALEEALLTTVDAGSY